MILRRLASSIRRQDWLAVTIEFVIVVAGIFVALQVTDWNEQRQLRERELTYLQRLSEDVAAMRAELGEIMGRSGDRRSGALRTLRALEQCDAGLASAEDIQRTFALYQNQRTPVIVDRTYQEMLASGALAGMEDRALSGEIAAVFSSLYNYRTFVSGVRISLPVIDQVLWRHVDLSFDERGRPILVNFDLATACRIRELRNAVWEIYDLYFDWETATVQIAAQVDSLSGLLRAVEGDLQ